MLSRAEKLIQHKLIDYCIQCINHSHQGMARVVKRVVHPSYIILMFENGCSYTLQYNRRFWHTHRITIRAKVLAQKTTGVVFILPIVNPAVGLDAEAEFDPDKYQFVFYSAEQLADDIAHHSKKTSRGCGCIQWNAKYTLDESRILSAGDHLYVHPMNI